MIQTITMPDVGEGVETGVVVVVHIQPGDQVRVEDTVVELETDKAVVEIPSTVEGKVVRVLVKEGDEVKVGEPIAELESDASTAKEDAHVAQAESEPVSRDDFVEEKKEPTSKEADWPATAEEPGPRPEGKPVREEKTAKPMPSPLRTDTGEAETTEVSEEKTSYTAPIPASPSIRRMARELGVDLRQVEGRGSGGRITESDVKAHVKERLRAVPPGREGATQRMEPELPDFTRWGDVDVQPIETVRRVTAESTTRSWHAVPHVTQFDEADITGIDEFLSKNAPTVSKAGGKLTVTAILTKVCAAALQKFPQFNASLDPHGQRIIFKKYVHIGIAVDTPRGLLMPVIRDADTKSITALAVEIVDLARRCREKKIKPTELEGGTFSISNQGGIGGVGFTPIVLWPQVAILGVSRTSTSPQPMGECIQWRKRLPLSLSYDHRIIDGADAARFLGWICESLASPLTLVLD
jgi:pyruvate dehydrogenase E2 component (dihydrolipoamide acetyltransferase)